MGKARKCRRWLRHEEGSDMELKPPSDFAEDMLDIVEEELVDPP